MVTQEESVAPSGFSPTPTQLREVWRHPHLICGFSNLTGDSSFTEKEKNEILLEVPLRGWVPNSGCRRQGELSRESQPAALVRFLESACYYECSPFQSSVLLPKIPYQFTSS